MDELRRPRFRSRLRVCLRCRLFFLELLSHRIAQLLKRHAPALLALLRGNEPAWKFSNESSLTAVKSTQVVAWRLYRRSSVRILTLPLPLQCIPPAPPQYFPFPHFLIFYSPWLDTPCFSPILSPLHYLHFPTSHQASCSGSTEEVLSVKSHMGWI